MNNSNRPPRGRSKRPTNAEIDAAWQHIRDAAADGDLQACAMLITLSEQKHSMRTDGGVYNVPGKSSGWRGDDNDPHDGILEKIRQTDPQSKQLPENQ